MGISKGTFEQTGVFTRIFILLAITLFFVLLISPIIALIVSSNPTDTGLMKLSQLILSIGVIIIPPLVLAYFISTRPLNFLHLDVKKINWVDIVLVFLFMIIIIPFINLLGDLNHQLVLPKMFSGLETWMKTSEEQATEITEKFLNVHSLQGLLFNIFLIAIVPAIGEELYFRGGLQGTLQSWKGVKVSIWIAAIIFSTIHMQFYGFVPRMLMGAFFGYLLFWSNNMWLPITAHFTNNVIAVIFYYLKCNGYKMPDIDSVGTGNTGWIGIASGAIAIFGIYRLKKRFQLRKEKITDF